MHGQPAPKEEIILEEDVWLGCNVVVLKGCTIGKGAVVAAVAVVTKSIPAYEIWTGVPAKKKRK
jgi:acetyltransferase-like isoleucine patch superfamily enzyme